MLFLILYVAVLLMVLAHAANSRYVPLWVPVLLLTIVLILQAGVLK